MITYGKIMHHGEERLKISFPYHASTIKKIKQIKGAKWSPYLKAWHIPYTIQSLELFEQLFSGVKVLDKPGPDKKTKHKSRYLHAPESYIKPHILKLKAWLAHKRYSQSTISTYTDAVKIFLSFHYPKKAENISADDMITFVNDYIIKNKYSYSYQNQVISGVKIFYREVMKTTLDVDSFERPRRVHKLPNVLSKEEIKSIIQAPKNTKHRAMLSLIYACGLRRSELLNIKPGDIDSKRNILLIRSGKGKKDRIAPISDKLISLLRAYYTMYKPTTWLFEGQKKGVKYSARSLEQVLKQSLVKANIHKPVTLHWLRHSYATHLMENGTDTRYIQELLGHKSSRTTEIYTHVSSKSLQNIKSPFDDL